MKLADKKIALEKKKAQRFIRFVLKNYYKEKTIARNAERKNKHYFGFNINLDPNINEKG